MSTAEPPVYEWNDLPWKAIEKSVTTSCGKFQAHQNAITEGLKNDACSRIMGGEFAIPEQGASDVVQPRPDCTADAV